MNTCVIITRIICCVTVLMMLCSCSAGDSLPAQSAPSQTENAATAVNTVCLPYSKKDSLNPYKAETKQNFELSKLLFDPLIKLNDSFEPELFIAEDYQYADKKCTVKLKKVKFTDGTVLTADDVIYSFNAAKESVNYKKQLNSMSASAADGSTVVFTLSYSDPNMINLLDFPIFKSGTADLKDENNRSVPPIGCGRYTLDSETQKLTANNDYYKNPINAQSISLIDCPDDDSLAHYSVSGTISSVYSDMSDNNVPKKSGEYIKSATTNLVFVGVNCNNSKLSDERVRLALSSAMDRTQISAEGYYGYAEPAYNVFSPNWSLSNSTQSINFIQNIEQTVAYFDSIGYNDTDSDGFRMDNNGKRVSYTLMYNENNTARVATAKLIAAQLKKCGIEIILNGVGYADYTQNLSSGNFELYIGEIKLDKSFYILNILNSTVIAGYPSKAAEQPDSVQTENNGQNEQYRQDTAAAMFANYYSGNTEIEAALSAFAAEMPFIPLCYRCGVTAVSGWLAPSLKVSVSDIYNGIESYKLG